MKTPQPFQPEWKLVFGKSVQRGRGLLFSGWTKMASEIDEFSVGLLRVFPRLGQAFIGSQQVLKTEPARLVWLRRMQCHIATLDRNTNSPRCLYYVVGLENECGTYRFKVFEDGRFSQEFK